MNAKYRGLHSSTNRPPCIQTRIRLALRAWPRLYRTLQSGRAVLFWGPWRHAARAVVRMTRPPQAEADTPNTSVLQFDSAQLVETLRADGMAMAGSLPSDVLGRVRAITDQLPPGEYADFHDIVPDVRALVQCPATVRVTRGYLRAEPELLECTLVVSHAADFVVPPKKNSLPFHFDYPGWHSLNLFIYLTDVSQDSEAHEVVVGTHCSRNAWDSVRIEIPDHEIKDRFSNFIRPIIGSAGTMFFEDTAAFHRRPMHTRRRVMLNIVYASHRGWLSKGRLQATYADYLRSRDVTREFERETGGVEVAMTGQNQA